MRAWLMCLGLLLVSPALAEEPAFVVGDKASVKLDTFSKRFFGTEIKGPRFSSVTELTILFIEGDQARVHGADDTFGWLPMDSLEKRAPSMNVDSAELQRMLEQMNLGGG